ncbi:conserved exported hypothetical protein [Candidatus Sulfobium mesophilum]|uniref:Cytochrome c family protein n=1 Tax=Candidatus Sulfobium mesophilum TaxID=2016548 RepID=A0A2U3QGS6_9BACT|nr:conserved exported hypothetical protein [Candidatus Sulfobium mesophilum]
MKTKTIIMLMAIALLSIGLASTSYAFHDGGAARCEGCHTMHNSLNNTTFNQGATNKWNGTQFQAGPYLLQGSTPSEVCLNCHGTGTGTSGYHVSTEGVVNTTGGQLPNQYTPGGDFSWMRTTANSIGGTFGHSIIAPTMSYVQDPRIITSPGGSFPANQLGCQSCHNPHGSTRRDSTGAYVTPNTAIGGTYAPIIASGSYGQIPGAGEAVGAYRLLGGTGYSPKNSGVTFLNNPPYAVAPSSYNRTDTAAGGQTRVAYGQDMSEWCGNCHSGLVEASYVSGVAGHTHPAANAAKLTATIAANYNAYVKTGDLTGTQANSFLNLVPYEEGTNNIATLAALAGSSNAPLTGPSTASNVACVSCHRVHASAFPSMTRFGVDALVTDETGAFEARSGFTSAAIQASYYGRGDVTQNAWFGDAQRALCNKCHVKD